MITSFADRLQASIIRSQSFICAGFDPVLESFPEFVLNVSAGQTNEESLYAALTNFFQVALEALFPHVSSVKPNLAFFEQYGIGGIRAFASICAICRERDLPLIADAKRGDIGNTGKAYSAAFLGRSKLFGVDNPVFDADALTVNPFLGFDTIQPFLDDCQTYGKGIFVLVKTSNPGSATLQGALTAKGESISVSLAKWLAESAPKLMGECGYSGLGAVVGATFPQEAQALRHLMPSNLFLIPGFGAQGASAQDAVSGFAKSATGSGGALINISRGLFGELSSFTDPESLKLELSKRATKFNSELNLALKFN